MKRNIGAANGNREFGAFDSTEPEFDGLSDRNFEMNGILQGKIIEIAADYVGVDVGMPAKGRAPIQDWDGQKPPCIGDLIEVVVDDTDDQANIIFLSHKKAQNVREWETVTNKYREGDEVGGRIIRKIKGGLVVDVGVNVFLPASQVDIRRPSNIANYIGQEIRCTILKIDEGRRNMVVSRRRLMESRHQDQKRKLLHELAIGQVRVGVVKNIVDFGAFVDLGGLDGLLHITEMSWDRIEHPTVMVRLKDQVEVMILQVDREREKIALGLKQKPLNTCEYLGDKPMFAPRYPGFGDEPPSNYIFHQLMDPNITHHERRDLIIQAENFEFDVRQRGTLIALLQNFVAKCRDHQHPDNLGAIGASIRKSIAGLRTQDSLLYAAHLLNCKGQVPFPLVVENEIIKMIVRKLSAIPITQADSCPELGQTLYEIARSYLGSWLLDREKYAAIALNAIIALALLQSPYANVLINCVREGDVYWFRHLLAVRSGWLADELNVRFPGPELDDVVASLINMQTRTQPL